MSGPVGGAALEEDTDGRTENQRMGRDTASPSIPEQPWLIGLLASMVGELQGYVEC